MVLDRLLQAIEREERAVLLTVIEGEPLGAHVLVLEGGERLGDGVPEEVVGAGRRADPRRIATRSSRRAGRRCSPRSTRRRRGCSSTARSTPPRRSARRRTCSAGGRSSPTRGRSSRRASGSRAPTELIVAWPEEALAQVAPDHATAVVVLTHDDKFDVPALKARARDRGVLRRRARLAPKPGAPPRAAARGRRQRGRSSTGSRGRAASTSAPTRSPRRRCRSSPRSSPSARAARAAR